MQIAEKIKICRVCGGRDLVPFFDLGRQPLANSLLKKADQKEEKYPLSLSWCKECNLVQLNHTVSPKKLFSKYVWVTGTSEGANIFAEDFCRKLLSRVKLGKDELVLEIASNDGTFLKPIQKLGFKVLGIDPAKNIVKMANASGVPSRAVFFGSAAAKKIVKEYGTAKVVFARNVLPHVADTRDFVEGLKTVLSDDGVVAIEAHYAKTILEQLHYDSIYHEHLCYFTLKSIEKLLNDFGLYAFDIDQSPISGGGMIIFASKNKLSESGELQKSRELESKSKTNDLKMWQKFASNAENHSSMLVKLITACIRRGSKIVAYGASARSSTMLNYCGIDSRSINVVYDKNPLKQKFYTAGSRIPIRPPDGILEDKPDFVVVLAWNFADEITNYLKEEFNYKGGYILPLPNNPRIIKT